jgi:predicted XRE-type DNA-binding protein
MAKPTFDDLWRQIQAEAKAEGPDAVAQLQRMQHRYRLGAEFSLLRKETGLTQDELADRTGIDQAEISRIERGAGNATEDTLARIAQELGAEIAVVRRGKRVAIAV